MASSLETGKYIVRDIENSSSRQFLINKIKEQIAENKKSEILKIDDFGAYGVPLENYNKHFESVLNSEKIADLVKRKSSPIVVDLMSPSDTLASLFEKISDGNKLGIAVSYCDKRNKGQKERDEKLGIRQIIGDILELTTWEEIEKTLNSQKADLIIERALLGKDYLTSDIRIHAILLNKAWKLCSNFGTMLIELSRYESFIAINGKRKDFSEWISLMKNAGIGVNYSGVWNVLKLVKNPDSPKNLPFLK